MTTPSSKQSRSIFLLLILFCLGQAKLFAYDFSAVCETGQTLYYNVIDAQSHCVSLTCPGEDYWHPWEGYSRPCGSIVLPNNVEYNGINYRVVSIDKWCFHNCNELTGDLIIPETVNSIGTRAFYGCSGFTGDLKIPHSVNFLGIRAFYGCSGFTGDLFIGDSVRYIEEYTFSGCTGFSGKLTIGASIISIGESAFDNSSSFSGIQYRAKNCETHEEGVLGKFGGELTIENTVERIPSYMFLDGSFVGELVIPNSVIEIGPGAFMRCHGLSGSLIIPDSVTSIGYNSFCNCSGFTGDLLIGNSVTNIGNGCFSGCSGFEGTLTLGISVKYIGSSAFQGCLGFSEIHYNTIRCEYYDHGVFKDCGDYLVFGNQVEIIPSYMFEEGGFVGSLNLPESVKEIGDFAFYNCDSFTGNLILPNSVTKIGWSAFANCVGFSGNLTIPNSVEIIDDSSFENCIGLSGDLIIGDSVTTIGNRAFSNCHFIGCVIMGKSLSTIGDNAFKDCDGFTSYIALSPMPPTSSGSVFLNPNQLKLSVCCGDKPAYEASVWHVNFRTIEEECGLYPISIDNTTGGTVSSSTSEAQMGQTIEFTVAPNPGMILSSLKAYNANNPTQCVPISSINNTTSHYCFTMPPFGVVVKASFSAGNSVNEVDAITASVYPNPTSGLIKINAEGLKQVYVSNIFGQSIFSGKVSGNEFVYDFGRFEAGLYLIHLETINGIVTKRVVVSR